MTEFADKVVINELKATIKQQNQTLLHICAELEAIKQCDPFDSVFIAYSVENISNMIETLTEQSIDEGCIGCAGPCKVVDVAAKLQKELDSTIGQLVDSRKRCDYLGAQIDDLKDRNIEDLKELYDFFKHVVSARDLTIKSLTTMCQSSGTGRNRLETDLRSSKSDYEIMRTNHHNTVAKLQDDIKGLEAEKGVLNDRIIDKALESQQLRVTISDLMHENVDLEAELSARKEDSAMLMKVVEIVKRDDSCPTTIDRLADWLVDYLDAPEGPPETPIDDLYRVTVTYAFLEMP